MKLKCLFMLGLISIITKQSFSQIYSSSLDKIPSGWPGEVFKLSKDYPTTLPTEKNQPWLKYNFKTQPNDYMNAVLRYFVEGNIEANWVVQNNKIRKWYHAPSMSWQPSRRPYGREFIHGLTRERNSSPKELYPSQTSTIQNWAVGFYNPIGAYTFGQVWADTNNLKINNVNFSEGTMTAKLLFTAAGLNEVPYLNGSLEWTANIHNAVTGTTDRSPQTVRLLQVDIAIKDSRANDFTGWVFGTFAYNANAKGKNIWEKLVPVGLMWGNDPGKFNGEQLTESWINPEFISLFKFPNGQAMHIGYKGRLNGPVDNPISSCLSCHSTSQNPEFRPLIPDVSKESDLLKFFRNIKSNETFDDLPTSHSLDYSLQLSGGVAAAMANRPQELTSMKHNSDEVEQIEYFITSMDDTASLKHQTETSDSKEKECIKEQSRDSKSFKWLDYLRPSIDLLIALITAFILVWKYLTQKQKEFAERIIENKRVAYSEFLKNFTETAVKIMHDKEARGIRHDKERMLARNQLLLYASDEVIKAYHDWIEYADSENHNIDKEVELFGKILIAIRKDIHGNSNVTEQEISNLNPFNRG